MGILPLLKGNRQSGALVKVIAVLAKHQTDEGVRGARRAGRELFANNIKQPTK